MKPVLIRRQTHQVQIDHVMVGSDAPVTVQSMTNTDTADAAATAEQVKQLADAGYELVRITVNSPEAAAKVAEIRQRLDDMGCSAPLVGDFALRAQWYEAQQPQVSLIVLNYNKPQLTLECVQSIWQHTEGYRYEVVLVDNGSADDLVAQLAPLGVAAQLVRVGINRFFGEGNNIGFEASRGRYVVFLNNDVTVTPGWLRI